MGLSNEERYKKIVWSAKHLEDELKLLKEDYHTKPLKKYSGKIWPALLNKTGNSGFWLFGGSFDNNKFGGCDLISTALEVHVSELISQHEKEKNPWYSEPKDDFVENSIQIENIVGDKDSARNVLIIWKWIENFLYAVNRYDDQLSEDFTPLKDIIANLQGDLFSIISSDRGYLDAYLMSKILEKCVDLYDDENILTKAIREMHLHHNFKIHEYTDSSRLMDMWTEIQFTPQNEISDEIKILYTIRCMGERVVSDQKKIVERFKDHVDMEKLESVFQECVEEKKRYDERNSIQSYNHDFCDLTWDWKNKN